MSRTVGVAVVFNHTPEVEAILEDHIEEILKQGCQDGLDIAKNTVAVETGRLRDSLHLEGDGKHWEYGSDLEYAPVVEYGGVNRPAEPFLRPAAIVTLLSLEAGVRALAGEVSREFS